MIYKHEKLGYNGHQNNLCWELQCWKYSRGEVLVCYVGLQSPGLGGFIDLAIFEVESSEPIKK